MPKQQPAHQSALNALLSEPERVEHAQRVQALRARNALLSVLERTREQQGITKRALAERAGLEASSVRRLLTSETANPTTDNAFRLMSAMGISLEATLPTGERVQRVVPAPTLLRPTTQPRPDPPPARPPRSSLGSHRNPGGRGRRMVPERTA